MSDLVELQARVLSFLRDDFEYFCHEAIRIRALVGDDGEVIDEDATEDGPAKRGKRWRYVPLVLNDEQRAFVNTILQDEAEGRGSRIIVLKARKLGISTVVQALAYWFGAFREGWESLTMAHIAPATRKIASIGTTMARRIPEHLRPFIGAKLVDGGLVWANQSMLRVQTQGSDHGARGSSPSLLHMSEVGLWDHRRRSSDASDAIDATMSALEEDGEEAACGTIAVMESTANGQAGAFYERVQACLKGKSSWRLMFFPWHTAKKHQYPLRPGDAELMAAAAASDDPESVWRESPIFRDATGSIDHAAADVWCPRAVEYGLTPPQVRWALRKWRDTTKFDQEYPLSVEMAFMASGRPVIPEAVRVTIVEPTEPAPLAVGLLPSIEPGTTPTWAKTLKTAGKGHAWRIYAPPVPLWSDRYVIGVDVAGGLGGEADASCIQVLDRVTKRQVAQLYTNTIPPDELGNQVGAIGRLYGGTTGPAYAVVEVNNHGLTTIRRLLDLGYPRLYTRDRTQDPGTVLQWASVYGFNTTGQTRPDLLNNWRTALVKAGWAFYSPEVADECRSFVYGAGKDPERMDHLPGEHSDAILASAMAIEGDRILSAPVETMVRTYHPSRIDDDDDLDTQEPLWLTRWH